MQAAGELDRDAGRRLRRLRGGLDLGRSPGRRLRRRLGRCRGRRGGHGSATRRPNHRPSRLVTSATASPAPAATGPRSPADSRAHGNHGPCRAARLQADPQLRRGPAGRFDLDDGDAAGRQQGTDPGEEGGRVAADADVAVQQDRRPHRPSPGRGSKTLRQRAIPPSRRGLGHGARGRVDAQRRTPAPTRSATSRPGPHPTSSTGVGRPASSARSAGEGAAPPPLHRQRDRPASRRHQHRRHAVASAARRPGRGRRTPGRSGCRGRRRPPPGRRPRRPRRGRPAGRRPGPGPPAGGAGGPRCPPGWSARRRRPTGRAGASPRPTTRRRGPARRRRRPRGRRARRRAAARPAAPTWGVSIPTCDGRAPGVRPGPGQAAIEAAAALADDARRPAGASRRAGRRAPRRTRSAPAPHAASSVSARRRRPGGGLGGRAGRAEAGLDPPRDRFLGQYQQVHGGNVRTAPRTRECPAPPCSRSRKGGGGVPRTVRRVGGDLRTLARCSSAPPRVLVVDDDPNVAEVVTRYLEREGFGVEVARDGHAALDRALAVPPDLVVLDLMLPGIDGLEVCRRLRALAPVPVIMLTAKGGEADRVVGLELGADDYLAKPFSPRELTAQGEGGAPPGAGAAGRRRQPGRSGCVDGDLTVDVAARQARLGGEVVAADRPRAGAARATSCATPAGPSDATSCSSGVWGYTRGRHVDGHRPRPAAAREGRARPRFAAAHRHGVGRRLPMGGRGVSGAGPTARQRLRIVGGGLAVAALCGLWQGLPATTWPCCWSSASAWPWPGRGGLRGPGARRARRAPLRTQAVVVGLASVVGTAAGVLAAARAMFVSAHDLGRAVHRPHRRRHRRRARRGRAGRPGEPRRATRSAS